MPKNTSDELVRQAADAIIANYGATVLDDPAFADYVADEVLNWVRGMSLNDARRAAIKERKRRISERQAHRNPERCC